MTTSASRRSLAALARNAAILTQLVMYVPQDPFSFPTPRCPSNRETAAVSSRTDHVGHDLVVLRFEGVDHLEKAGSAF
jgi:hypothetical protein